VLVEETARLLDAAVVANLLDPLRSALTASAAAAAAATLAASARSARGSGGSSSAEAAGAPLPPPPRPNPLLAAATAPLAWVHALDARVAAATPAPLRGVARLATAGLRLPAEVGASAATRLAALEPLFTATPADAAALQTAADLAQTVASLAGVNNRQPGSQATGSSRSGSSSTADLRSLAATDPAAAAQALAAAAQDAATRAVAAWQDLQGSEAGALVAAKLASKGPAAAGRFAKLLAAAVVARAADRLDHASTAEAASNALDPAVAQARAAATRLLDPLALALER
jgi:hypothetical protein